jgi:hypothetical protein
VPVEAQLAGICGGLIVCDCSAGQTRFGRLRPDRRSADTTVNTSTGYFAMRIMASRSGLFANENELALRS